MTTRAQIIAETIDEFKRPSADGRAVLERMGSRLDGIGCKGAEISDAMEQVGAALEEDIERGQRELQQFETLTALLEGLPDGVTLREAAEIKAKQGNPVAIAFLKRENSLPSKLMKAFIDAAVDAHPDWSRSDRGYRYHGTDPAMKKDGGESLVDWFQKTHPLKAREVERQVRANHV
jgi:hypothetical protein